MQWRPKWISPQRNGKNQACYKMMSWKGRTKLEGQEEAIAVLYLLVVLQQIPEPE